MALSAFEDKQSPPEPEALAAALGRAATHWNELKLRLDEDLGPLTEQWNHAGAKYGWSLRLRRNGRVVVYLTPCEGHFLAGLVFGEKAVREIRESGLARSIVAMVEGAKPYAEGRGVRFEVREASDVATIRRLAAIKLSIPERPR